MDSICTAFWTVKSPGFSERVWLRVPDSVHNKHEFYHYAIIINRLSNEIIIRFYELGLRSDSAWEIFCNILCFYGEEMIALLQTPKLEGYPFFAVCDCLFDIFALTLHIWKPFAYQHPVDDPFSSDTEESTCHLYQLHTKFYPTSCCRG